MQPSGVVIKVVESRPAVSTRRTMMTRSEALGILVAVLIVAIWLLASWTATAAEIELSVSAGAIFGAS